MSADMCPERNKFDHFPKIKDFENQAFNDPIDVCNFLGGFPEIVNDVFPTWTVVFVE